MSAAELPALTDAVSDETPMTYLELALIGSALLSNVASVERMGWSSPGSSLDYTADDDDHKETTIVRDFIAWTSGRTDESPDAEARLRSFIALTGWNDHVVTQVGALLARGGAS